MPKTKKQVKKSEITGEVKEKEKANKVKEEEKPTLDEILESVISSGNLSVGEIYTEEGAKSIINNNYYPKEVGDWVKAEIEARAAKIKADNLKAKICEQI